MPDFPIIDTHVHFWDWYAVAVSWQEGLSTDRPFGPADLDDDSSAVELVAIVFVKADVDPPNHIAEAEYVTRLAEADQSASYPRSASMCLAGGRLSSSARAPM